jgi:hypothetical protein
VAKEQPILVRFDEGVEITLDLDAWSWLASGEDEASETMASMANSLGYEYSPADGHPGHAFARLAADSLGGKAELPPAPPREEGVIH